MRIKRIGAQYVKNQNTSYELGPITIIRGDNGVGKTAIVNAVELLNRGLLPQLERAMRE